LAVDVALPRPAPLAGDLDLDGYLVLRKLVACSACPRARVGVVGVRALLEGVDIACDLVLRLSVCLVYLSTRFALGLLSARGVVCVEEPDRLLLPFLPMPASSSVLSPESTAANSSDESSDS
jgi:hypothetical protein